MILKRLVKIATKFSQMLPQHEPINIGEEQ